MTPARLPGALAVEAVTLHSRDAGRAVLRGVSFALEPGAALAVSGPSGAGKSALASVLIGATAATMGEVRIDGVALRHWDPAILGRGVGYLPQDAELLPGTVAENIARFSAVAPEDVIEAARRAGAHEMILCLPEGYDTETRHAQLAPLARASGAAWRSPAPCSAIRGCWCSTSRTSAWIATVSGIWSGRSRR